MSLTINSLPIPNQEGKQPFQKKVFLLTTGVIASLAVGIIFGPLAGLCALISLFTLATIINRCSAQKPGQNIVQQPALKLDTPEWLVKKSTGSAANPDLADKLRTEQEREMFAKRFGLDYKTIPAHVNKILNPP